MGILGIGGLGSTGAKIAALKRAEVHVAEPKRELCDAASTYGAVETVGDAGEWTDRNFDLVVDFAGFNTTSHAIRAVRPGGLVVEVGAGRPDATVPVLDVVERQVTVKGFMGGTLADIHEVIDLLQRGGLKITMAPVGFDEIPATLERLSAGRVDGRAVALLP